MRIAFGIEYNGQHYSGWQRLSHCVSVQSTLENAVSQVADEPVQVVCAGRTDAGVHAVGQVVHFDTRAEREPRAWLLGTNSHLPNDISVCWCQSVTDDFHARHSAISRHYRYLIINRLARPAVWHEQLTWIWQPLTESAMHTAAQALIGEHDFSGYRAAGCQSRSTRRRVESVTVRRDGDLIAVDVVANAFLHHMVRNIVGVLVAIGRGDQPVEWAEQVLAGRDRTQAGITAPSNGLYLLKVNYPEQFALPDNSQGFDFFNRRP